MAKRIPQVDSPSFPLEAMPRQIVQVNRASAAAPLVTFEGVTKAYGENTVLSDIDLTIEPGQFMVLLGPSGGGKSTMLRCLGGLERIDQGEIRFDRTVVSSTKVHLAPDRRNLAMVFQDFALWPHMTVLDNVAFASGRRGGPRPNAQAAVKDMLERVGLLHLSERYPSTLSGGEQQRVSLARALVGSPGLILFDEPLSSLDADLRERLRVEIADLTRQVGSSALYITHDQIEAFALADTVCVLNEGRLVQLGTPEAIYRAPASAFVARFTGVAGEIHGSIEHRLDNGDFRVRTEAGLLDARGSGSAPFVNSEVTLMVRSAPIRLLAPQTNPGGLAGRIVDVAFRGRGYDHVVDVGGAGRLLGVFSEERWERHALVEVRIPVEGCLVFPRSQLST